MTNNLMMHGLPWDGHNVDGWLASEKFDGCRAFWTGEKLLTKSGREYRNVPERMLDALAEVGEPLDCELCVPNVPRASSLWTANEAARWGRWPEELRLIAFDRPASVQRADCRLYDLRHSLPHVLKKRHPIGQQVMCANDLGTMRDYKDALDLRNYIWGRGGEGIMLLRPDSLYTPGRRDCLLKMKMK